MTPYAITKSDIETCTSERLLRLWHGRFYDRYDEVVSEIEAAQMIRLPMREIMPLADEVKTLRYLMRRIEHRALELGFEQILQRKHHHQDIIERYRVIKAEKERLEAEVKALRMGRAA